MRRKGKQKRRRTLTAVLFLAPSLAVMVLFLLVPILYGFRISFLNYNMTMPASTRVFVGWKNYAAVLSGRDFRNALAWTLEFVVIAVAGTVLFALLLACLLSSRYMGGIWGRLVKTTFILPMMLCPLIVSNIWYIIFAPNYGLVNSFLNRMGWNTVSFFGETHWARLAVLVTEAWLGTPYVMVILMAAMTTVPTELYEAAELEGAGRFARFRYITLPGIRDFLVLVVSIRLMDALRMFDISYALTEGGPQKSTQTLAFYIYETGFKYMKVGEASAAAFILFLLIAAVTFFFILVTKLTDSERESGRARRKGRGAGNRK